MGPDVLNNIFQSQVVHLCCLQMFGDMVHDNLLIRCLLQIEVGTRQHLYGKVATCHVLPGYGRD